MTITSSALIRANDAYFEAITDIPSVVVQRDSLLITNDRALKENTFTVTVTSETYSRLDGSVTHSCANLVLEPREFMQLLTMITDFASTNGFTPTITYHP
jgi:hypothetical protein